MPGAEATRDASLGQLFRDARERRGLTLRQVSSDTKIPLRHLEALERDDLGALPPGPYLRGQIRACARAVHLDSDLALTRLDRLLEAKSDAGVEAPATGLATRRRRLIPAGAALVVCVAVAATWFWRQPSGPVSREPAPTVPEPQPAQIDGRSPSEAASGTTPQTATPIEPSQGVLSPSKSSDTQLVVTTEPSGARVTVNGIGWGTSPVTIRNLSPGDTRVRVSLDGYLTAERGVSLSEGQAGTISIRLRSAP